MLKTTNLGRRDFLRLAGGALAAFTAGATLPIFRTACADDEPPPGPRKAGIDYKTAKAIPTICFGCTTHCGVIGWVQDGVVRRIEGNPLDINSRGKICSKANAMISYTYYPDRLLYPMKRVGARGAGKWKRISWDEANNEVAGRLKKIRDSGHPDRFVFHYGRDKTKGFTSHFCKAFGTPNRVNRRSICSSNRRAPLMSFYGRDFEWETQDVANTKYILNFGANPMEAYQGGMFIMQRIQDARVDNGARMVTFEVRPSATASVSDEYYPIMPGTDGCVAYAMCYVILEEGLYNPSFWKRWANYPIDDLKAHIVDKEKYTPEWAEKKSGIPATDIRRIAREFAKAAPHCTTMSNRGSAKHYNGVQADRGIRLLDVLVGNVGQPGGFCLSSLRGWSGHYGQDGLPKISIPGPKPSSPKPWLEGTPEFEGLPAHVQEKVRKLPEEWQKQYTGELNTPVEYPLAWHWYAMRVGQLIPHYIREGRQKVDLYMSFTYGAAYGYPEANVAREVLLDEALIPYHVCIDINYSEQAKLADLLLPDATSLERWDAHSQNCHELIPYTGIRQPLMKPLGEARPVQLMLRDWAHLIGGDMPQYFDFPSTMEGLEGLYEKWYANISAKHAGGWEEFKRRGIWHDETREKDYELYERPVAPDDLEGSVVDEATGVIYKEKKGKKTAVGIMQDGKAVQGFPTPTRKIQVHDPIFEVAAKAVGLPAGDPNGAALPTWFPVPELDTIGDDELVFTIFKWNVHTQGRSGHWKYQSEIVHANPVYMHPSTGAKHGLKNGDMIEVTVKRPKGLTYRANDKAPVGSFRQTVRFLEGVHPKVICCSHHVGHWEYGAVARAENTPPDPGSNHDLLKDRDIADNIWWAKDKGGTGNGVHINDVLPINPAPLVGGQNWNDNVATIRKV
jgi:thiosulfate reductase/polysulfide reductase chain A